MYYNGSRVILGHAIRFSTGALFLKIRGGEMTVREGAFTCKWLILERWDNRVPGERRVRMILARTNKMNCNGSDNDSDSP